MEGCQNIDFEIEGHALIDDNQFTENQVGFSNCELAGGLSDDKDFDTSFGMDANDRLPELNESIEPQRNQKNGRYNLRKSLAWDSAFFTSAGVLDAEELSSMITGSEKSEKHLLPGIQEDVTESTESIPTLGSDTLTLETLEDDLFVDIRASIQRSSIKKSNLKNSSSSTAAMGLDSAAISSLKKEDAVSQNKNPKPGLSKTSSLQTLRTSKGQHKQNIGKLESGKAPKQDSGHSQMKSIAKVGETNSILSKAPKTATSSSISSSTTAVKRDSMGTGRVKSEYGSSKLATVSSKGTQPPKVSVLSGVRRAMPKPAVSPKRSMLGTSTTSRVLSTRSSTSSDSSSTTSNMSSVTPAKSTLTARRNPGKSCNVGNGPSGSIPKTPSRGAVKNKLPSSGLSAYLTSAKISSSVSPASSISEWSSASSSSSSMMNQRSNNLRTGLDTSSCRSIDGDIIHLDPRTHSADRSANVNENHGVILTSNNSKKSSAQPGTLHPSVKPSGLRLPSPKIGFFDGVKASGRTPNGNQQSQSGLPPKNSAATSVQSRSSNSKLKNAKVPTARMVPSLSSIKPDSPKATSPASFQEKARPKATSPASSRPKATSPASFQEKARPKATSSVVSPDKGSPHLSLGVNVTATEESCSKAEKVQVEDVVKQVIDADTGFKFKENFGDSNMFNNMGSVDIKTYAVDESNASVSEYINRVGGDVLVNKDHIDYVISDGADKENDYVKYREGLTRDKRDKSHIVDGPTYELIIDTSECPATASESAACRAPFAPMNFSHSNDCIDMPKDLSPQVVVVADKTVFALPSFEQKENS